MIGHDWGADLAWKTAWLHPERIRAVAGLSVPFAPRAPAPPLGIMRRHLGEDFYMVWFQEPGVAEAALERDVRRTLATTRVWDSAWSLDSDEDPPTPSFMTEEELQVYVDAYDRTGFRGGLNYYRNIDRNWERTADVSERRIEQPALFLTGERDPVRTLHARRGDGRLGHRPARKRGHPGSRALGPAACAGGGQRASAQLAARGHPRMSAEPAAVGAPDRFFVTGGSGFLGRNVIRRLVADGTAVSALAAQRRGSRRSRDGRRRPRPR